jgi:nucleotide-binding universal stress UspA family protein
MPQIKKILFPTSCSENAKKSFRYTLAMAKYFGASIHLLHVCEPNMDILVPSVMRFRLLQEQKHNAQKILNTWVKEFEIHNIPIIKEVEMGFARETIAAFANKSPEIDLIALGAKDNNSIAKVIWGSVISKSVGAANAPVLVIPKGIIFQDIQNIAYVTPDIKNWRDIYQRVKELAVDFDAKLFVTHLPSAHFQVFDDEEHIVLDDYVSALHSFSYNANLHLLVTFSVARNSFKSMFRYSKAQKMAFNTTIPLLLLRN